VTRRQQLTEVQLAALYDAPAEQRELVRHYRGLSSSGTENLHKASHLPLVSDNQFVPELANALIKPDTHGMSDVASMLDKLDAPTAVRPSPSASVSVERSMSP